MSKIDRIRNFPKSRTALAYVGDPVLITDPNGVLVYLNPKGEESFGIELKLAVGRSLNELLPLRLAQSLLQGLGSMHKSPKALRFEVAESDPKYYAHLNPIMQEGKYTGAIIFLRPELNEDVIPRLNQSLFSNMLDEIHRPVNQLTVLFSKELENEKEFHPFYEKTQALIKQTFGALNNLIDVSPVLIGEIRLAHSRFQPSLLLRLARRSFGGRAESKSVKLLRLDHKDLPELIGDQAKLNRVLVIFLDLALDMAGPGEIIGLGADLALLQEPVLTYSVTITGAAQIEKDLYCLLGDLSPEYIKHCAEGKLHERNLVIASRLLLAMKGQARVAALERVGNTLSFSVPVALAP